MTVPVARAPTRSRVGRSGCRVRRPSLVTDPGTLYRITAVLTGSPVHQRLSRITPLTAPTLNAVRMVGNGTDLFWEAPGEVHGLAIRSYRCEFSTKAGADPQPCGSIGLSSPKTVTVVTDPGTLYRITAVYDGITGPPKLLGRITPVTDPEPHRRSGQLATPLESHKPGPCWRRPL